MILMSASKVYNVITYLNTPCNRFPSQKNCHLNPREIDTDSKTRQCTPLPNRLAIHPILKKIYT